MGSGLGAASRPSRNARIADSGLAFTIDVATTIRSVVSSSGRRLGSRGDPPSQNVPKPELLDDGCGLAGVLLADRAVGRPDADVTEIHRRILDVPSASRARRLVR